MDHASQQRAELYAAYIEMTVTTGSGHRRRLQYIVLPQLPARLAPGNSPTSESLCYFTREQDRADQRSVWQYRVDDGRLSRTLPTKIQSYLDAGWAIAPVVVCEIHPTELAQIITERKTPYRIMNRLKKVAKAMYRIDIS